MNVKTLCLGILQFGDATGYEIRKMAQEGRFGHFIEASYGSIYPALVRLEDEGLVTSRREEQDGRPDRKVYSINDGGRTEFAAALYKEPREDVVKSEFLFVMMCADLVAKPHVSRLIDERLAGYDAKIEHLRSVTSDCEHSGSRFVCGFGLAMYEALRKYLSEHRQDVESVAGSRNSILSDAAE